MRIQNKKTFKSILLTLGMVVCLILAGCRDKSIDHFKRGIVHLEKGEHDRAISDYTKAIEINPRFAMAYGNRGNAYSNKGRYDQAFSDFSKALEINPRDAEAYYNRGTAYVKKGQYDQAISDFNKALEINPRDAVAYYNRGLAYYGKGERVQGRLVYKGKVGSGLTRRQRQDFLAELTKAPKLQKPVDCPSGSICRLPGWPGLHT